MQISFRKDRIGISFKKFRTFDDHIHIGAGTTGFAITHCLTRDI